MSTEPTSGTPPRGWYTDPDTPGLDRWWDGAAWTRFTHKSKTLRTSMYGPDWGRIWWPGPNRAAFYSLLLSRIAFLTNIALLVVAGVLSSLIRVTDGIAVVALVVVLAAFATAITALLFGILAVRRSDAIGGTLPAAWGLGLSIVVVAGEIAVAAFLWRS